MRPGSGRFNSVAGETGGETLGVPASTMPVTTGPGRGYVYMFGVATNLGLWQTLESLPEQELFVSRLLTGWSI